MSRCRNLIGSEDFKLTLKNIYICEYLCAYTHTHKPAHIFKMD